jgi:uncharacterized protein (TIGR02246 family)
MLHKIKCFLLTILALFIVSCQPMEDALTDLEKQEIANTIKQVTQENFTIVSQLDTAQIYSGFSQQTTVAYDGKLVESWESQMKYGKALYANLSEAKLTISEMKVDVLSRDVAVLYGTYHYSYTDKSGNTMTGNPAWTWVFARENDRWMVRHAHISNSPEQK